MKNIHLNLIIINKILVTSGASKVQVHLKLLKVDVQEVKG